MGRRATGSRAQLRFILSIVAVGGGIRVPPAILRKLYVEGSLANARKGMSFTLHNRFSSATFTAIPQLLVDGGRVAMARVTLRCGGRSATARAVKESSPVSFPKNEEAIFSVEGRKLKRGVHAVQLTAETREWGRVVLDFEASI